MSAQPRKGLSTRDEVPDIANVPKYVAIHESFGTNNNGVMAFAFADRDHKIIYQPAPLFRFDLKVRTLIGLVSCLDEVIVVDDEYSCTRIIPHLKTEALRVGLEYVVLNSRMVYNRLNRLHPGPQRRLNMAAFLLECHQKFLRVPQKDPPEANGPTLRLPAP